SGAHDRYSLSSWLRCFGAQMVRFTPPPCDAGVISATPAFPAALSQKRKRLTLAATILGSSMAFIDGSVVNIALPAIQQALHADAGRAIFTTEPSINRSEEHTSELQ